MIIDAQRLSELMSGHTEPETHAEELFLEAYELANQGLLLKDMLITGEILDRLTYTDLVMYIVGYAMGQATFEEVKNLLEDYDTDKVH